VKEVTVKYLGDKLPPGLGDALEAGVEAITDPSSDTYAAATGKATLTVGSKKKTDSAENRVLMYPSAPAPRGGAVLRRTHENVGHTGVHRV
jgi:hypothetical protein